MADTNVEEYTPVLSDENELRDIDEFIRQQYANRARRGSNCSGISGGELSSGQVSSNIVGAIIFEPRDKFSVYKINVTNAEGQKWFVYKRYSDFVKLNKELYQLFPMMTLHLPPKRWFRDNFELRFIRDRKVGLQTFIKNLFSLKQYHQSEPVQKFFRFDNPPPPEENAQVALNYCQQLEVSCKELKCDVKERELEITRLHAEIDELVFSKSRLNSLDSCSGSQLLTKNIFERQIWDLKNTINLKDNEIKQLKSEYHQNEAYINLVQLQERQYRAQQIRDHKQLFALKQRKVYHIRNQLRSLASSSSLSDGSIDIERNDAVPSASDREQELEEALHETQAEFETLYNEHIEHYRVELENLKVQIEKSRRHEQKLNDEIDSLKSNLKESKDKHEMELQSRDIRLQQFENEMVAKNRRISDVEEIYFHSILLGAKLNMVLYGQARELSRINIVPSKLFAEVRSSDISTKNWPSWIARKISVLTRNVAPS